MSVTLNDTIVALATPFGISALAVIRLSGSRTLEIIERVFVSSKEKDISCIKSHTLHYGSIIDGNNPIDEVMAAFFKKPRSYTGEDLVEITCHGGAVIISAILDLFIKNGARPADPGEFTRRAFLNGKMDLSQAESVNGLINAGSARALKGALKVLKGDLREKLEEIKSLIFEVKANIDADIEWGETEELEIIDRGDIVDILKTAAGMIKDILANSRAYSGIYTGYRVVIAGRPNAGKSSLFNYLLKKSRSIVNSVPGTTRDVIESEVVSDGYLIRYVDTAGLGLKSPTEIDRISAQKSRKEIETADTLLILIDCEKKAGKPEKEIFKLSSNKKRIVVITKSDRKKKVDEKDIYELDSDIKVIKTSVVTGEGIDEIKEELGNRIDREGAGHIMVSARQKNSFKNACSNLENATDILESRPASYEIASYELSEAVNHIGLIDGAVAKKDILDRIFSEFCIGK